MTYFTCNLLGVLVKVRLVLDVVHGSIIRLRPVSLLLHEATATTCADAAFQLHARCLYHITFVAVLLHIAVSDKRDCIDDIKCYHAVLASVLLQHSHVVAQCDLVLATERERNHACGYAHVLNRHWSLQGRYELYLYVLACE